MAEQNKGRKLNKNHFYQIKSELVVKDE